MSFEIIYFSHKVSEQVDGWSADLKAEYGRLIEMLIEFGPELGIPKSRAMGDGLFELRPKAAVATGRAFYCFRKGRRVFVLHAFIKKTAQTPLKDLALARKRQKEIENAKY